MDEYQLSFGKIILLRDDIAELQIDDGYVVTTTAVEQFHDFLRAHLRAPFSLLVNKINAYSYTYPAQQRVATLKELNATAVVVYTQAAKLSVETVAAYPREQDWNLKIFSDRNDALAWLVSEQYPFRQATVTRSADIPA